MMKMTKILAVMFAAATPALASAPTEADVNAVRVKFQAQVMKDQLPAFIKADNFKQQMLDAKDVSPATYTGSPFLDFHKLAVAFFEPMEPKALTALAMELRAKTGEGEDLSEEARANKVDAKTKKKMNKWGLGGLDLSGLAGDLAKFDNDLSWGRAMVIYKNAVQACGIDARVSIYDHVKANSSGSVRKMSHHLDRLTARFVHLTSNFVNQKLAVFDKANGVKNDNNAEQPKRAFNAARYLEKYPHVKAEADKAGKKPEEYAEWHFATYKKHFPNLSDE